MAVSLGMRSALPLVFLASGAFLGCLAAADLAAAQGTQEANEGFTPAESRRLRHGLMVRRPERRRRGDLLLIGGTSFQIVDHPPEVVWRAIRDTRAYRYFLPQVDRVRLLERGEGGRGRIIQVVHQQGPLEAGYHLRLDFAASLRTVQFRIDPDHDNDVQAGWGYLRVQPYGERRSIVTWAILADIGSGIAVGLLRSEIEEWILSVPTLLRRYLGWASGRYQGRPGRR